jgi:hypothetical protein
MLMKLYRSTFSKRKLIELKRRNEMSSLLLSRPKFKLKTNQLLIHVLLLLVLSLILPLAATTLGILFLML